MMTRKFKLIWFFTVLVGFPVEANATLIMLFRTEEEAIIAADSKIRSAQGSEYGRFCKIHITNNIVWTTAGITGTTDGSFDVWSSAQDAITTSPSLDDAVSKFSDVLTLKLKLLMLQQSRDNPIAYDEIVRSGHPLTAVFIDRLDIRYVDFVLPDKNAPDKIEIFRRACPGRDCPTGTATMFLGNYTAASSAFENQRAVLAEKGIVAGLNYLVELQQIATPEWVSGPLAILRIGKSGELSWLQNGLCK